KFSRYLAASHSPENPRHGCVLEAFKGRRAIAPRLGLEDVPRFQNHQRYRRVPQKLTVDSPSNNKCRPSAGTAFAILNSIEFKESQAKGDKREKPKACRLAESAGFWFPTARNTEKLRE
ncbi:MAG TPA: hypothetical protein VGB45_08960, partial [Abditibacterium sp.]